MTGKQQPDSLRKRWHGFAPLALATTALIALVLTACGEPASPKPGGPDPEAVVGYLEVRFEHLLPPVISSSGTAAPLRVSASATGPQAIDGVRLEPTDNYGLMAIGDRVYVYAEFELFNDTDEELPTPVLLGHRSGEGLLGSAVSDAVTQDGGVASNAMVGGIRPTHHLVFDGSLAGTPEALTGDQQASDFVAFAEAELPTEEDGPSGMLFPYGFALAETVPAGGSSKVQLGFGFPTGSALAESGLASFTWHAALTTGLAPRVVQAPEENHARGWQAVLARAEERDVSTVVAIGPGQRAVTEAGTCPDLIGLANVRVAGTNPQDTLYAGLVATTGLPEFEGCEGER